VAPIARRPRRPARLHAAALLHALVCAWLLVGGVAQARADGPPLTAAAERSVKAAYIYRFLPYVEWPADAFERASSPIVIGVIGADDVAAELEALLPGRLAQGRPLQVRRLTPNGALAGVHVLYIGPAAGARTAATLTRAVGQRSVLTITDTEGGLELGGIVNFISTDGRVRFEVAVDNADKGSLKLSSRLLQVALRVRPGA
jgi:hypothetical protein